MKLNNSNLFYKSILLILIFNILFFIASSLELSEKIINFFLGFEAVQLDELFLVFFLILMVNFYFLLKYLF